MALEEGRNFCGAIRSSPPRSARQLLPRRRSRGRRRFAQDSLSSTMLRAQPQRRARHRRHAPRLTRRRERLAARRRLTSRGSTSGDDEMAPIATRVRHGTSRSSTITITCSARSCGFQRRRRFAVEHQVVAATALQLFTLGIPCIYYGTEQAFAGPARHQSARFCSIRLDDAGTSAIAICARRCSGPTHPRANHDRDLTTQVTQQDATLPGFGAFGTVGQHCFDDGVRPSCASPRSARVRAAHPVLRDGRQYQRQMRAAAHRLRLPARRRTRSPGRASSTRTKR